MQDGTNGTRRFRMRQKLVSTVKKAHLTQLRDRWVVHMEHGPEMDVTGNIIDHEYTIARGGREVAVVTKRAATRPLPPTSMTAAASTIGNSGTIPADHLTHRQPRRPTTRTVLGTPVAEAAGSPRVLR